MKFKLCKRLVDDTSYYETDIVDKYADYVEEQGRLFAIGNLLFDTEAMKAPFACHSSLCMPSPEAPRRKSTCCCTVYSPRLSNDERDRIDKILPALRKRFPLLDKRLQKDGTYYEWDDSYDRMICKGKSGACVFLTPDDKEFGFHACMIHAYCLENKLSRHLYEPSACIMFPLFIFELTENDRILVTSHTKEARNVGEEEKVFTDIGCMKRNKFAKVPLYISMKETLVYMFGQEVWNRLDAEIKKA